MTRTSCSGKPATKPVSRTLRTPFSTDGMNWLGIVPPFTASTNSKPLPRGSGSTLQEDFTELPGAARLLLVAAVTLGLGGDGLAERDRRRARVELDLVLRSHLVEDRLEVHLAQAPHHGLVRLRVVLDAEAGVLGRDLVQHVGHLLLVLALLRHHGEAEDGSRQLERARVHVSVLGGVVQDVVELDLLDPGDGADVAGDGLLHFGLRFSAQHVEVRGLDGLAALADVELHVRGQAPLVHAEHREAADVGIGLDLEDVREDVLAGIGNRREFLDIAVAPGGCAHVDRRIPLGRIRQQLDDDFEQLGDAGAGFGGGEDHGNQMPLAQCLLEGLV